MSCCLAGFSLCTSLGVNSLALCCPPYTASLPSSTPYLSANGKAAATSQYPQHSDLMGACLSHGLRTVQLNKANVRWQRTIKYLPPFHLQTSYLKQRVLRYFSCSSAQYCPESRVWHKGNVQRKCRKIRGTLVILHISACFLLWGMWENSYKMLLVKNCSLWGKNPSDVMGVISACSWKLDIHLRQPGLRPGCTGNQILFEI